MAKYPTFIYMRGLFILIVSCLYFIAPLQCRANVVSDKHTYGIAQGNGNDVQRGSLEHHQVADIASLSPLSFNNVQTRNAPILKDYLPVLSIIHPYVQTARAQPQDRYRYCKPIRLILIFPQHYFW